MVLPSQATENLQLQHMTEPKTHHARVALFEPKLDDLKKVWEILQEDGVPGDAELSFQQWNSPATSWYIIATWYE